MNEGSDAFKPELYGDLITVERTIRPKDNSIKLMSHVGGKLHVVSQLKAELQAICDLCEGTGNTFAQRPCVLKPNFAPAATLRPTAFSPVPFHPP